MSVVSGDRAAGNPVVGFARAAETLQGGGVDLATMVGDGRLPVTELDDTVAGLECLRFASVRVEVVCREFGRRRSPDAARFAGRMGPRWEVVANLVARDILPSRDECVLVAEADRFVAEHVIGSVLAREMRTSPRALEARLALRGIGPVAELNVDGLRQNIYRRSDLPR